MGRIRLSPTIREEVLEHQKKDLAKLLNRDFGLILRNAQFIINNERYSYCLIPGAYLSAVFIPESGPVPLGVLIKLWEKREWMDRCSRCGEWVYIIGAAYNSLNEACTWWGICSACNSSSNSNGRALQQGTKENFIEELYHPVRTLLKQYENLRAVSVQATTFVELLQVLKGRTIHTNN